jgi:hypothetical protein
MHSEWQLDRPTDHLRNTEGHACFHWSLELRDHLFQC